MKKKAVVSEAPTLAFSDAPAFESWLEAHVGDDVGVWIKIAKKGSGIASVTDDEAVDLGLCFGWISGQRKSLDATHYLQKYVPRRARSRWSQVNVDKVEALSAQGRMRASGWAEVDAAKADGRWAAAYESQRNATVPPELEAAFATRPNAAKAFESLSKTERYAIILKLVTMRTEKARAAQLDKVLSVLDVV